MPIFISNFQMKRFFIGFVFLFGHCNLKKPKELGLMSHEFALLHCEKEMIGFNFFFFICSQ